MDYKMRLKVLLGFFVCSLLLIGIVNAACTDTDDYVDEGKAYGIRGETDTTWTFNSVDECSPNKQVLTEYYCLDGSKKNEEINCDNEGEGTTDTCNKGACYPGSPSNLEAKDLSSSGFRLDWDKADYATEYKVIIWEKNKAETTTNEYATNNLLILFSTLKAGTTYRIIVGAKSDAGYGKAYESLEVTTNSTTSDNPTTTECTVPSIQCDTTTASFYRICNSDGTWGTINTCPSGEICTGDVNDPCDPASTASDCTNPYIPSGWLTYVCGTGDIGEGTCTYTCPSGMICPSGTGVRYCEEETTGGCPPATYWESGNICGLYKTEDDTECSYECDSGTICPYGPAPYYDYRIADCEAGAGDLLAGEACTYDSECISGNCKDDFCTCEQNDAHCPEGLICEDRQCIEPCAPQSDEEFCAASPVIQCGTKTGTDNCNEDRTVEECGPCSDDKICDAGSCIIPSCSLTSAFWDPSGTVVENDFVELIVNGEYCDGEEVIFVIKEDELITDDDVKTNPPNAIFNGNTAKTNWTAEYISDGTGQGLPEYYFIAQLKDDEGIIKESNSNLSVQEYDVAYCETIEICSDYQEETECINDVCRKRDNNPAYECDSEIEDCYCYWNATSGCNSAFGTFDSEGNLIGSCLFEEIGGDDCGDGFLSMKWLATWNGELPKDESCVDGENTIQCAAEKALPFFEFFNIIAVLGIIALTYVVLILREKKVKRKKK